MRTFLSGVFGVVCLLLAACDAPAPGATAFEAEPLKDLDLRMRLAGHEVVVVSANEARQVVIQFRADGSGLRIFTPGDRREPFTWTVQGNEVCAGANPVEWQCARTAISGDNITLRFPQRGGGQQIAMAGKLRPI